MNYNLVIFDLDNTLLDFDKMELGSLSQSLEKHNIEATDNLINSYISINKDLWAGLESGTHSKAEILELRFEMLFEKYNLVGNPSLLNKDYLAGMSDHIHLIDHAEEILNHCLDKVKLVIVTNGVKSAQDTKMDKSGLNKYFSEVIISDVAGYHKPNVKIFDYLENKIGKIDKDKTMIIGDSLTSDIQGGINYGIDTCWFNPKSDENTLGNQINYEIRSLNELYDIL